MTVSALENNDECRKHYFSMPPVTQVLNKNSLSLALKVDFCGRYFSSPMPSQGELIGSRYLSRRACLTNVQRRYLSYFGGIVEMKTNVTLQLLFECLFLTVDKC